MEAEVVHYEFINAETGNIIAYVSFAVNIDRKELAAQLEKKKIELAIANKLYIDLIYWQEHEHSIR